MKHSLLNSETSRIMTISFLTTLLLFSFHTLSSQIAVYNLQEKKIGYKKAIDASVIYVPGDYATIQEGIDAASAGDTVKVAAGTYHENDIRMKEGVVIQGAGIDETVIDGDSLTIFKAANNAILEGFTLTNSSKSFQSGIFCWSKTIVIQNNKIDNCYIGISAADSAIIQHNIFVNNLNYAIFCGPNEKSRYPEIKRNLFFNNTYCVSSSSSDIVIQNNTMDNNQVGIWIQKSDDDEDGVSVKAVNNIVTNSKLYGLYLSDSDIYGVDPQDMHISYNDFWENLFDSNANWVPDSTNIFDDPMYAGNTDVTAIMSNKSGITDNEENIVALTNKLAKLFENEDAQLTGINPQSIELNLGKSKSDISSAEIDISDYYLLPGSPCIDTGDPDSPADPDGTRADIGAFPYTQSGNASEYIDTDNPDLLIYPNPFRETAIVEFAIPKSVDVAITLHDITGQTIALLTDAFYPVGTHRIFVNNSGNFNVPSGIYLIRMKTDGKISVKKVIIETE